MKFPSKILIVLAVVNVIACRPPKGKNIEEKQNTSWDNPDAVDVKAIQEIVRKHTNPQERQPLGSFDLIEPRPKEIRPSQDVIEIQNPPPKNRFRRHRRSTDSRGQWSLLKRGSQTFARTRRCDTTSAEQDDLNLQQEYVKFLFDDELIVMSAPAGCKTMTTTSIRVCSVEPETPVQIQQNPLIVVFKRICEDAGQRNSGEGLGAREYICEQAYLDVRLANQTDIISVESGCVPKLL